jgi:hypothetical protein
MIICYNSYNDKATATYVMFEGRLKLKVKNLKQILLLKEISHWDSEFCGEQRSWLANTGF